jgi:hypothetical protein
MKTSCISTQVATPASATNFFFSSVSPVFHRGFDSVLLPFAWFLLRLEAVIRADGPKAGSIGG